MSKINRKLVIEIGINHLGEEKYLLKNVQEIIKLKIQYVTIQILDDKFYKKRNNKNYLIDSKKIIKNLNILRENKVKIGFAVVNENFSKYVENYSPDFFKVLSWSANNIKLLEFLSGYNKPVYISLGTLNKSSINILYKKISNKFRKFNKFKFIHTQLNYKESDLNLNFINYLMKNTNIPICYGHHAKNSLLPIYLALALKVDKIFIYVKLSHRYLHPDEDHALYFSELPLLMKNLEQCEIFLGSIKKTGTSNQIAKIAKKRKL